MIQCADKNDARDPELGATLVESAIVLPLFLLLVFASIELLRATYTKLSMQYILAESAREALVTQMSATQFQTRVEERLAGLGLPFDVNRDELTVCPASGACTAGVISMGAPGNFMVFRMTRQLRLFFGHRVFSSLNFRITANYLGRNEPP